MTKFNNQETMRYSEESAWVKPVLKILKSVPPNPGGQTEKRNLDFGLDHRHEQVCLLLAVQFRIQNVGN